LEVTEDSSFAIDPATADSISETESSMLYSSFDIKSANESQSAFTAVLEITENQEITNVNAGMRMLRLGKFGCMNAEELRQELVGKKEKDVVMVLGLNWYVVKTKTVNNVDYAMLLMKSRHPWFEGVRYNNENTPGNKNKYEGSMLQSFITKIITEEIYLKSITEPLYDLAVVPILGDNSKMDQASVPTAKKASEQASRKDIFFAPSYLELYEFNNIGSITSSIYIYDWSPLSIKHYANQFWGRTESDKSSSYVWGVSPQAGILDNGLICQTASDIDVMPAVWVRVSEKDPPLPVNMDVVLTKTVTGKFADYTKDFTFDVYFSGSEGKKYDYIKDSINGTSTTPNGNTGALGADGKATVTLKHGQKITFKNVPNNITVRFEEQLTANSVYKPSYKINSGGSIESYNTNDIKLADFSGTSLQIDFINNRTPLVPTGIADNMATLVWLMILSATLLALCMYKLNSVKRAFEAAQKA
jgi:hypothetical protein